MASREMSVGAHLGLRNRSSAPLIDPEDRDQRKMGGESPDGSCIIHGQCCRLRAHCYVKAHSRAVIALVCTLGYLRLS